MTFTNQPSGVGPATIPDARISARFSWWFELKTQRDALRKDQLDGHLSKLDPRDAADRLFVLTPDPEEPALVSALANPQMLWCNFAALSAAIDDLIADPMEGVDERTRFLLRELQALMDADGLLAWDDTVVVAARRAYGEWKQHHCYVCQANRSFRSGVNHFGFYTDGEIKPEFPEILHLAGDVEFTSEEAARRKTLGGFDPDVGLLIESLLAAGLREEGATHKVFLLCDDQSTKTRSRPTPIKNDTVTQTGAPWAWTLGQRYGRLSNLLDDDVQTTSAIATE